jgi:hypothetical protein
MWFLIVFNLFFNNDSVNETVAITKVKEQATCVELRKQIKKSAPKLKTVCKFFPDESSEGDLK